MRLRVGTFIAEVEGWPDEPSSGPGILDEFVLPDTGSPTADFFVRLTVGHAARIPPHSPLAQDVDIDREHRAVTVRRTGWRATFLLPERQVDAHLVGSWSLLLESLLSVAVQFFSLETRTALLLHASSVERGGKAYVFTGHSGAGKTTVAMLSRQAGAARILREEMVFVGGLGSRATLVVATLPIREKHRASAGPGSWPLAGIYWLEQADVDAVEPLGLAEAVRRLATVVTIGVRDRMLMLPALDLAEELARRASVKILRFRRSAAFWDAIDADLEASDRHEPDD